MPVVSTVAVVMGGFSPETDLSVALAPGDLRAVVSLACSELKVNVDEAVDGAVDGTVDGAVDGAERNNVDPSEGRFSLIEDVVVNR